MLSVVPLAGPDILEQMMELSQVGKQRGGDGDYATLSCGAPLGPPSPSPPAFGHLLSGGGGDWGSGVAGFMMFHL